MEQITQSLAGRVAILKLSPFFYTETERTGITFESYEDAIFRGGFPRIYDKGIDSTDFYPAYAATYLEKDVRLMRNIGDLSSITNFLHLCAGRTGQLLNIQSLAMDAGVSPNTAKAWLSMLEASYIVHFLQPHHRNFGLMDKREAVNL